MTLFTKHTFWLDQSATRQHDRVVYENTAMADNIQVRRASYRNHLLVGMCLNSSLLM
jgi:hypothetical protein